MEINSSYKNKLRAYTEGLQDKRINNKKNIHRDTDSFKKVLNRNLGKVNQSQIDSDVMTNRFIAGQTDSLQDVILKSEEARLHLELAVQVRNKMLEAYKEINNMQI